MCIFYEFFYDSITVKSVDYFQSANIKMAITKSHSLFFSRNFHFHKKRAIFAFLLVNLNWALVINLQLRLLFKIYEVLFVFKKNYETFKK